MWAKKLQRWKAEQDVTLQQIADAVGMTESAASRYLRGHVGRPSLETLEAIAAFFGHSLADLFTEDDNSEKVQRPRARMTREAAA